MDQQNFKICDMFMVNEAKSLCIQCFRYYCDGCFKQVHDIKENSDHMKENIDFNVPIDTHCPEHKKIVLNLFCLDEKGINYYI